MLRGALLVAIAVVVLPECEANAGATQCPLVNKYIQEHSSEMIIPNISSYPNTIALRKKNHSSSDWNYILNIRNGKLTYYLTDYKTHFSILENGLMVLNFSKILIGEYQLVGQLKENVFQHIFLHILEPSHHGEAIGGAVFIWVIMLAVLAVVVLAVVVLVVALWWKCRRGRSAHPSTGAPGLGNEPVCYTAAETTVTLLGKESGTVPNGMP